VFSSCFALASLEIGLRTYFHFRGTDIRNYQPSFVYSTTGEDRARFSSHPFLPYAPRPNDSRKMYPFRPDTNQTVEIDYTNNSLGFRTPERPFEKPANVRRIVTLGGSTTFDGPSNDLTWPALLEKKLNEHYANSGVRVEVINLGVDMAGSPMSLIDLEFIGLAYQPDLVISYDGVNEVHSLGLDGLVPDYRSNMQKFDENFRTLQSRLPRWAFHSYLLSYLTFKLDSRKNADVFSQVFEKQRRLQKAKDPMEGIQFYERNLRLMRAVSGEYNAKFLAATAHWTQPNQTVLTLNDRLRTFFAENKIEYLDLDNLLPHGDWSLHVDAVHWTPKGLELVATHWQTKIVELNSLGLN
jgi:hypothetical protein